jgi:hypothetical protein
MAGTLARATNDDSVGKRGRTCFGRTSDLRATRTANLSKPAGFHLLRGMSCRRLAALRDIGRFKAA